MQTNIKILSLMLMAGTVFAGLPSSIIPCHRSDPQIADCIKQRVNELRPKLVDGNLAEGFQVPRFEPMSLQNIEMSRGQEFKAVFSDLSVYGPSQFIIEKLKVDLDNLIIDIGLSLPKLSYQGKYLLKIKLLLLDIAGKGNVSGNLENTRARVRLRGKKYEKNGQTYLKFERFQVKIMIGESKIKMDNLFNGDPTLGMIGNQFINDNIKLFTDEITPGLENSLAATFTEVANDILKNATFDEIFPE